MQMALCLYSVCFAFKTGVGLQGAEQCDKEGDGEIGQATVEDGDNHQFLAAVAGDDGQGGVHCGGAAYRDGSQLAEPAHQQRGGKQGNDFAQDIAQQGDGSHFGTFIFGDDDAGQRVVAEA